MRTILCLFVALGASSAMADRDLYVPKGKKIRDGVFRSELFAMPGSRQSRAWLGTGFLQAYDLELCLDRKRGAEWRGTFDASYNFAPPIIDVSPGISIGVQDALNVTDEGRAAYLAMTYRYGNEGDLNQDVPTELTFGFWSRKTGLFFLGLSLPFSNKVFLLGEHNSERLAGGLELRPFTGLALKTIFETGGTSFGVSLSRKF